MDDVPPLASRIDAIAPFHVMEVQTAARALESRGVDVVHMEIGEPDFPTPEPVAAAAKQALDDGAIYYTSALGLPALREAIAGHYRSHYGAEVDPARVIVTAGSSAALLLVLGLIVDRDSAIMMADPNYPCNRHFVRTLEGIPQPVAVDATTRYQLTAELVARHWTAATRGVLVATPSNPTGTTVAGDELARIAAVAAARRGHLVVDEIYLGLTYDPRRARPSPSATKPSSFRASPSTST
jgi:aspartate/methionine/tyrosine aminotransferase